jgi:hypothetical protein
MESPRLHKEETDFPPHKEETELPRRGGALIY